MKDICIYTTDKLNNIYTTSPFMALKNNTYISEEAIKKILSPEQFKKLKENLRIVRI